MKKPARLVVSPSLRSGTWPLAFLLAALVAVPALARVSVQSAQSPETNGDATKSEVRGGLRVTTFETPRGSLTVYLPADLAAGDTISGTVSVTPQGTASREIQRNTGELSGWVIEFAEQRSTVAAGRVAANVPQSASGNKVPLRLRDPRGRVVAEFLQPVNAASEPATSFVLPEIGQTGRPILVKGPFDGRFETSSARLGGSLLELLAESPRGMIFRSPADVVGPSELVVSEAGETSSGPFRNVGVGLSATATNLTRGQRTEIKIEVKGLQGLERPLPLRIANETPSTVRLAGGEESTIFILPELVTPQGAFSTTREATGLRTGGFRVRADVGASADPGVGADPTAGSAANEKEATGVTRRRFEDTGDELFSGVPVRSTAEPRDADSSAPSNAPTPCRCLGCSGLRIEVTEQGRPASRPLPVAGKLRFEAVASVECSSGCPARVDGRWHLTFIPFAASGWPVFLEPSRIHPPAGTALPPLEVVGAGAAIDFSPDNPGTVIARFSGRCYCGESVCEGVARVASAELTVGYPPPSEQQLDEMRKRFEQQLPKIPRPAGARRPTPEAVGTWLAATTTWRPGRRYLQKVDLPEDAVGLRFLDIIGTGSQNVETMSFSDKPMSVGDSVQGTTRVFGALVPIEVGLERGEGGLRIRFDAPVVDRFNFRVSYLDAEGNSYTVNLVCPGTSSAGRPVADPCQAPSPGWTRVVFLNIDPSRFEGVSLEIGELLQQMVFAFGGRLGYPMIGSAWDAEGRKAIFAGYLLRDAQVCPRLYLPFLEQIASVFGAKIEVKQHSIVIKGSDFGEENLLPPWLGGRRPPWVER